MKKLIIILLLLIMFSVSGTAQFSVGLRDTRYFYGQYTLHQHYFGRIEQSVYSEAISHQYMRGYLGYKTLWQNWNFEGSVYFGSTFNRNYHNEGAMLNAKYSFWKRLFISGTFNPHHDSDYGYKTCFNAYGGVNITNALDVIAGYSTLPEYRMSEKRVRIGVDFHTGALNVSPLVSLATTGASKTNRLRMMVSFNYNF